MTGIFRRFSRLDAVAAAYAGIYFCCLAVRAAGVQVPYVLDLAFYPLGLVLAWLNWRNSRVDGLDPRTRMAWRLLASAALVLWVSGSIWTFWISAFGPSIYANLIDRVAFVQYVLSVIAYLLFPSRPIARADRVRFALDVLFICLAGFVIAVYMGLKILLLDPTETATIRFLEVSFDWIMFVVVAIGCMQKRDPIIRWSLTFLLAASLSSIIGNYLLAVSPHYANGDPVDGFWFLAWCCRWTAVRLAWHEYEARGTGAIPDAGDRPRYIGNPFAYVLAAGAFVLLFAQIIRNDQSLIELLAAAAMAMGGLLMLRQYIELRENRRLVHERIERESRFTSLVTNSSDVVLLLDGSGTVTYVSPSLTRVFGPNVHVGPGTRVSDVLASENAPAFAARLAGARPPVDRFDARVEVAPGVWRDVEGVWTDLRDEPPVNAIVLNCRDVTERNAIERHVRQTQKVEAMGHLAGGLAHDLNNVLAIVRGYTELLRSELEDQSAVAADLDQIVKAVDRAASVTQKVLAFSRKTPGKRVLLDVAEVIDGMDPMFHQLLTGQVDVRFDLQRPLWPVRAEQGPLEQVLVNLVTNARDAMPDGGTVELTAANRTVANDDLQRRGVPAGDYVAVTVRDHGPGMSADVAARVFEPFFTTKTKDRGTGLGLAIVHGIVTDVAGHVLVDTAEGRGSTFTVLLPRAADTAPAGAAAGRPPATPPGIPS